MFIHQKMGWREREGKSYTREKYFQKAYNARRLLAKVYKEPLKLKSKEMNTQLKWANDLNRCLTKDIQMANRTWKDI
jgi:hypothetical protein